MAGGLYDDVAGKTQVVAQGEQLVLGCIAGRVLALGREGKFGAGTEDVAMRIYCTGGHGETGLAGAGVPVQPAGGLGEITCCGLCHAVSYTHLDVYKRQWLSFIHCLENS